MASFSWWLSAAQVNIWRSALKWVVLWLTLSVLTILNSIALVIVLQNDVFALICAVMFCWSGVLGLVGAIRTLLGHCLAREHDLDGALEGYHLKVRQRCIAFQAASVVHVAVLVACSPCMPALRWAVLIYCIRLSHLTVHGQGLLMGPFPRRRSASRWRQDGKLVAMRCPTASAACDAHLAVHAAYETAATSWGGVWLQMVEILGFTTCALSALASGAHFVSEQIVTRDMHLPACDKGDTHCMEFYNMIIIM